MAIRLDPLQLSAVVRPELDGGLQIGPWHSLVRVRARTVPSDDRYGHL